jgi:hypothetical protein
MDNPFPLDTREKIGFYMEPTESQSVTPEKPPTPWLADSEWLLEELAKTREAILRIPARLDNASDIKSAIDRIWHLERTLRDLLHYHREGQRSFAKRFEEGQERAAKAAEVKSGKIVRIRARMDRDFKKATREIKRIRA